MSLCSIAWVILSTALATSCSSAAGAAATKPENRHKKPRVSLSVVMDASFFIVDGMMQGPSWAMIAFVRRRTTAAFRLAHKRGVGKAALERVALSERRLIQACQTLLY